MAYADRLVGPRPYQALPWLRHCTEAQHLQVREALLNHLVSIEDMMIGHHVSGEYSGVVEYIRVTNVDRNAMWGTDIELITASHMLNTTLSMTQWYLDYIWAPQC